MRFHNVLISLNSQQNVLTNNVLYFYNPCYKKFLLGRIVRTGEINAYALVCLCAFGLFRHSEANSHYIKCRGSNMYMAMFDKVDL